MDDPHEAFTDTFGAFDHLRVDYAAWITGLGKDQLRRTLRGDDLPAPSCPDGYTQEDLATLGLATDEFHDWMWGRGQIECSAATHSCDPPHGPVTFVHDVARFLARGS